MQLNPYLNFDGTCREAFEFYAKHLGATIVTMMTCDQAPASAHVPPEFGHRVLHARIELAGTTVMASDGPPNKTLPMRSAYLTLSCDSDEQVEEFYTLLADGGEVFMAIGENFYATRFGMLRDRFGVNWMLIRERPMPAQS
jgi:PhnB protein